MASLSGPGIQSTALVAHNSQAHLPKTKTRMQKIQDFFTDKSFRSQFADYQHFHKNWMGDIIVLVGTSTSGKSSIINALRKIEPNRIEDGGDHRRSSAIFEYCKKRCPDEITMLEEVMDPLAISPAIRGSSARPWKEGVSALETNKAERMIKRIKAVLGTPRAQDEIRDLEQNPNIELQMFDEAFEHSRRGQSVIFDELRVDSVVNHALMRNFDGPMRVILVYCPFHILSSRMENRNKKAEESGDATDLRVGVGPLMQFSEIYTQKTQGQSTFEVITKSQAIEAIDENFDKMVIDDRKQGRNVPPDEIVLEDKARVRQDFLDNIGFMEDVDQVEIAPQNQHLYQDVIDTGHFTAEDSARKLHEGTGL